MFEENRQSKPFFFFSSIGNYTGVSASTPRDFLEKLAEVDAKCIEFHMSRGDFQKWFRDVWHMEEIAEQIDKIKHLGLRGDAMRSILISILGKSLNNEM